MNIEPDQALRTGKRTFEQNFRIDEKFGEKKYYVQFPEKGSIQLSKSHMSPLICPGPSRYRVDERTFFKRRIYRLPTKNKTVVIPELSDYELRERIPLLLELYKKNKDPTKTQRQVEPKLSNKESLLVDAAFLVLSDNYSAGDASKITGIKKSKIVSMVSRISQSGNILPFMTKKKKKLQQEHIDFLHELLQSETGCLFSLNELKILLLDRFSDINNISLWTLYKTLREEKYSYKRICSVISKRHEKDVKLKQKIASQNLISALFEGYRIIFIDETSIQTSAVPYYGWGRTGEKLSIRVNRKNKNHTIVAAITDEKLLGCQIIRGGMKKEDYAGFISTIISHYQLEDREQEIIIFADNVRVHHAKFVMECLSSKITFLFNATYTPMLNPIENFFSKFKRHILKQSTKNIKELYEATKNSCDNFTIDDFKGYIRHTLKFAVKALNGEDL